MTVKLSEAQKKLTVQGSGSIAAIMQQVLKRENKLGRAQEHFWVVGLNAANKILFIELIALGRQNRITANPPDVFHMAIYKLALKLILVHNHPSGELAISGPDKGITDRLLKVGEIINIDVLDHLIISEKDYLSFLDEGIIGELKQSDTWRLMDKEQEEMRELKRQIEKQQIEKGKASEIAKNMKAANLPEEQIKQLTGLKLTEIRKL